MNRLTLLTLPLIALLLSACASQPTSGEPPEFPNPDRAWKHEGITVTPEQLSYVQIGMPKQQLYTVLGTPHFGEGFGNNRYWDYLIQVRDANNKTFFCQLKIEWGGEAARLHAPIAKLHWKNPVQCPPAIEKQIVYRDVVKEVIKEVVREVPAAVTAKTTVAPHVVNTLNTGLEVLFAQSKSSIDDLIPESKQRLDQFIAALKAGVQLDTLTVTGHADRTGNESSNQRLSQERADSVAMYVLKNLSSQMKTAQILSQSSKQAIVSCDKLQGAALNGCLLPNRRAVIQAKVISKP